jgi:hypothetical protein
LGSGCVFFFDDCQTYSRHEKNEADDVGGKEEVVCFLSPILGGEENNHVEADESDGAPDSMGEFYRFGERPFQGPFVN